MLVSFVCSALLSYLTSARSVAAVPTLLVVIAGCAVTVLVAGLSLAVLCWKRKKSRGFDAGGPGRLRVVVVRGRTPTFYYGLTVLVLGAATGCLYLASYVPDIANVINAMIDKGASTAAFGKVTHSLNGTSAATEAKVVSFVTHTLFVTGMSLFFHSMLATAIIIWKFVLADEIAEARGGLIVFLRPSDILFGGLTI